MKKYWIKIITPPMFSVYRDKRRTYNDVDALNRQIVRRMGNNHLNQWDFISKWLNLKSFNCNNFNYIFLYIFFLYF